MTPRRKARGTITALAGTNGAGKSSIGGAHLRSRGSTYFNPDEYARKILGENPGMDVGQANAIAWTLGKDGLEDAISAGTNYTFETTLGGNTIPELLAAAHEAGHAVRIWYVGLDSPELHIARVAARVRAGGHDIPESKIRERYDNSRSNLIRLLPTLSELLVYDNSAAAEPGATTAPPPMLILHVRDGTIQRLCDLARVPEWAKPICAAAIRLSGGVSSGE